MRKSREKMEKRKIVGGKVSGIVPQDCILFLLLVPFEFLPRRRLSPRLLLEEKRFHKSAKRYMSAQFPGSGH